MATTTRSAPALTSVAVHGASSAAEIYRSARAHGFPAEPKLNLRNFGGRTIEHLTFTNVYLGAAGAWSVDDVQRIDQGLADKFLAEQLHPEVFEAACEKAGQPLTLRRHDGYDHGYYFISTFIADHVRHHAEQL